MSSNPPPSLNSSAIPPPPPPPIPPPPPPGTNYIATIAPSLHDLMVGHTFLMIIFTLFIAMFYFSSPPTRRKPIFVLTAATVILALASGVLLDYRAIHTILSPLQPIPISFDLAIGILGAVQSIIVDTVLLVRLLSVYPRSFIGNARFAAISALPFTLKLLRVINLLVFIVVLANASKAPDASVQLGIVWASTPYLKIEWVAQVVDNSYASTFFLWRLWSRRRSDNDSSVATNSRVSFSERIRILFWIASTNFVFPVLFSIVQLIVVLRPNVDVAAVNDIVLVNTSVAVIGVVFATVWAGTVSWQRGRDTLVYYSEKSNENEKSDMERGNGIGGIGIGNREGKSPREFKYSAPVFALPVHSSFTATNVSDVHSHSHSHTRTQGSISSGDTTIPLPREYAKAKTRGIGIGAGAGDVAVTTISVHSSASASGSSLVGGESVESGSRAY